jgi:adenylate cyclase
VRIQQGLDDLPSPSDIESATLSRVGAPTSVRLACQVRPESDVAVAVLFASPRLLRGFGVDLRQSQELTVTAMFVDLRNSTALASGRLPFDVIFVVDRYVQAVTAAVRANAGAVSSVAGDGVMSVFGLDGDSVAGTRNAFAAAEELWRSLEKLGADLAMELSGPLKFGIGVHTGLSVVGMVGLAGQTSIQFLGDTGNLASRLENLTKEMGCTMIVSAATVAAAGISSPDWRPADLEIRGKSERLKAYLVFDRSQLAGTVSSLDRLAETHRISAKT